MIYFRKNNDLIEKYNVNFDKSKIKNLRQEIIDNCSFIEHIEFESDYSPRFIDESLIKNFYYKNTGEKKEYFEETRDIYFYSYDEYKPPYLIKLIDKLLNNEENVLRQIFSYDTSIKTGIDEINNKIKKLNTEFNKIDIYNIEDKKNKLNEIEELVKLKKLNKNQKNIENYYNELITLIDIKLVDKISVSELKRIESFLEINLNNKINDSKVLKKEIRRK